MPTYATAKPVLVGMTKIYTPRAGGIPEHFWALDDQVPIGGVPRAGATAELHCSPYATTRFVLNDTGDGVFVGPSGAASRWHFKVTSVIFSGLRAIVTLQGTCLKPTCGP